MLFHQSFSFPVVGAGQTLSIETGLVWAFWLSIPHVTVAANGLSAPNSELTVCSLGHLLPKTNALDLRLGSAANTVSDIEGVGHALQSGLRYCRSVLLRQFCINIPPFTFLSEVDLRT